MLWDHSGALWTSITNDTNAKEVRKVSDMKILRLKDVTEKTGLSRSTIYYLISQKQFPSSIPLGARSVGWLESEVNEWLQEGVEMRKEKQR